MIRFFKKAVAAVLSVSLGAAVAVCSLSREAAALQYTGTPSYMSGKYYQALRQVCLTGDARTDIVSIAQSQLGYQEGGSPNQLSGQIYGGVNHTEYGAWYGAQDMWCAMFVSWCADLAGVSTDVIPSHSFTPNGLQWFANRGQAYAREEVEAGSYTPQPGDLVYFKSSRNTRTTNHVGLVTGYADGRLYTIEGNVAAAGATTNGGMVVAKSYPITNTYIVYICAPDYDTGGTNVAVHPGTQELRNALSTLESGGELGYDAISRTQGLSLGIGQWYGPHAMDLLMRIRQADEAAFARLDTVGLGALLDEKRLPLTADPEMDGCLQKLLSSRAGIQVQEEKLCTALDAYREEAQAMGVEDPQAQLLCAAVGHLGGSAVMQRCVELAREDLSKSALLAALEQVSPQVYRSCQGLNI